MRPKYEIGQTVYDRYGKHFEITAIKKNENGLFAYQFYDLNYWYKEEGYTLEPLKKYYILYRSADGLEKKEECQPKQKWTLYRSKIVKCKIDHLPDVPPCDYREYSYQNETKDDDSVTYIYDEVI